MMKRSLFFLAVALVLGATACKPKVKTSEITSLQRKEAATLVSEAEFAMQIRDLPRAEGLFAKATALFTGTMAAICGLVRVDSATASASAKCRSAASGSCKSRQAIPNV